MKKNITYFLTLFLFSSYVFSQSGPVGHLTIFSEDGDKFTLILNGEQINDVPQTNLRVEDLNQEFYNAKIKFQDNTLQDISKNNLSLVDVDGIYCDVTYKIKRDKNNKTKMKLNYFSSIPVRPDFIPSSNVHVIHYGQPAPPPVRGGVTQTTTTTTTTQVGGVPNGVNVGMNVGGINMGISINDNTGGTVTQTTTTTNVSSSVGAGHQVIEVPAKGCGGKACMTSGNFNTALATIKKQNFEDTRLKTAKQVVTANCLSVDQIIQIANTFSFEDNKLEFAKYAYDFCSEPKNYFQMNGIFKFSDNVDALSDYVQSRN